MSDLKNKRWPKTQILTALLATIPAFTYGIQIGWLSPMAPLLKSADTPAQAPVTDNTVSWMAASLPLAAITGIPFFSFSSDKYGRRISIIALSVFSSLSWVIKLWSPNSTSLITARVIAGLAAGGCFVTIPVYIKEIADDTWRGTLGSLVMTICKLGVITVYAVGLLASYYVNQALYLGIALAHVVVFNFMPESPVFLVRRGLDKEAIKTIAWLRGIRVTDKTIMEEISKYKQEKRSISNVNVTIASVVQDKEVFSTLRMTLVLMAMQTLSGCFALMNYAADIFTRAGTEWSPNTLAIFVGSLQLAGSFFTTMSIEKFGRKIPLAGSSFMVGLCMMVLGTSFLLGHLSLSCPHWLPVLAVCLCIFSYGAGLAPVPFVIMAEVFSFQHRAKLAGVVMAFSFFCSSTTVLFFTPIANVFGEYVVFYTFAAVGLLGGVYTIFFVPETRGKSLEEIKEFWRKKSEVQPTSV